MPHDHLFVMDSLDYIDREMDTSIRLAHALAERGANVYMSEITQLSWHSASRSATGLTAKLSFPGGPETATSEAGETRALDDFSGIHMRKDPPFDMDYISATWLLQTAKSARHYNAPQALRTFNEKLAILDYPDAIRPALVSSDADALCAFVEDECLNDAVIKPLLLFSGKGIHRIKIAEGHLNKDEARQLIHQETNSGKQLRMVQPFDSAIYTGEVRAFAIGGEPLAWCLKKPKDGEFMANSSFGSTRHQYVPSQIEYQRVKSISQDLLKAGISVVGYDLIGSYISEINITSPRLMTAPDDREDYFGRFADWLMSEDKRP